MKRLFDLTISSILLILSMPIQLILFVIIRIELGSPVLFIQQRAGLHGKGFFLYKFRTMSNETDDSGQLLPDHKRITRFGAWIRKYSLDELPQLLNVLKGDLSLVGPRPLLMQYLPLYTKEQARRHEVKPGITGWAQVNGRNHLSWEDKFSFDVWYVDHQSIWLDIKILCLTLIKVFNGDGISRPGYVSADLFTGSAQKDMRRKGIEMDQNKIYLSPPHLTGEELSFLEDALDSNWIAPLGPQVDQFEKEIADYIGVKDAALVSSGTAAIHLALRLSGVKKGDLIFCSSFTFIASANPILYEGAIPVLIDSEPETWNMSPKALERALEHAKSKGNMPKAVIVVHLYGQSAKMAEIKAICDHYGIPIIEDAAEAMGSTYNDQKCGGIGDIGIFSFNGNKLITSSGGGVIVSNNDHAIKRARFLASQARDPAPFYQHSEIGFNYRMSNLLAAVGRAQLKGIEEKIKKRRSIFAYYKELLGDIDGVSFMPELSNSQSNHWLTTLILDEKVIQTNPLEVIQRLDDANIEARPLWKPLHLQPVLKDVSFYAHESGNSVAENLFKQGICLPSGSSLTKSEQEKIVKVIKQAL
jgi:pyridoxal phosphate-dependent aminotransferase EpsN